MPNIHLLTSIIGTGSVLFFSPKPEENQTTIKAIKIFSLLVFSIAAYSALSKWPKHPKKICAAQLASSAITRLIIRYLLPPPPTSPEVKNEETPGADPTNPNKSDEKNKTPQQEIAEEVKEEISSTSSNEGESSENTNSDPTNTEKSQETSEESTSIPLDEENKKPPSPEQKVAEEVKEERSNTSSNEEEEPSEITNTPNKEESPVQELLPAQKPVQDEELSSIEEGTSQPKQTPYEKLYTKFLSLKLPQNQPRHIDCLIFLGRTLPAIDSKFLEHLSLFSLDTKSDTSNHQKARQSQKTLLEAILSAYEFLDNLSQRSNQSLLPEDTLEEAKTLIQKSDRHTYKELQKNNGQLKTWIDTLNSKSLETFSDYTNSNNSKETSDRLGTSLQSVATELESYWGKHPDTFTKTINTKSPIKTKIEVMGKYAHRMKESLDQCFVDFQVMLEKSQTMLNSVQKNQENNIKDWSECIERLTKASAALHHASLSDLKSFSFLDVLNQDEAKKIKEITKNNSRNFYMTQKLKILKKMRDIIIEKEKKNGVIYFMLCGKSGTGKSTIRKLLTNPYHYTDPNGLYSDTKRQEVSYLSLKTAEGLIFIKTCDIPGWSDKQPLDKQEETLNPAKIDEILHYGIKANFGDNQNINKIGFLTEISAGISGEDIDLITKFLENYSLLKTVAIIIISRADLHKTSWKEGKIKEIDEHQILSKIFNRSNKNIAFSETFHSGSYEVLSEPVSAAVEKFKRYFEQRKKLIHQITGKNIHEDFSEEKAKNAIEKMKEEIQQDGYNDSSSGSFSPSYGSSSEEEPNPAVR